MGNLIARSVLVLALLLAPISHVYAQLVTRVIDGDTLVVQGVGTVRLIGVDTPETVDPRRPVQFFGKEASEFTRRAAAGKVVRLEFDIDRADRFGRTLAYVHVPDGVFLNAEIIKQGYGQAYTQFPFRYLEEFRAYEREAREAGRGLWAKASGPVAAPKQAREQGGCVDINQADTENLQRIIHIGPERAQQIVSLRGERPFRSLNELTRVRGIAAARLRDIIAEGSACVR